jgi:hypothetical protein
LTLINSELPAETLEDPETLKREIVGCFGYTGEAKLAVSGIIQGLIEQGVFYSHILSPDWEKVFYNTAIHVIGIAESYTEISVALDPTTLPVGMVAEIEGSALE